jgi:hypothetical protein
VGLLSVSNVISNATTTTANTVVDSAKAAVSLGLWSSLAIIAFSFTSCVPVGRCQPLVLKCKRGDEEAKSNA